MEVLSLLVDLLKEWTLPSTVMPFILRGVSLLGIDSVIAPMQLRERAWKRLSENININKLEEMTIDTSLDQVEGLANEILQGKVREGL